MGATSITTPLAPRIEGKLAPVCRNVTVVLGAQWGDEGKGKLVHILGQQADLCCRCQGGNNAGHTIVDKGIKYDFHLLPSGVIYPRCTGVIGNGVVIHLPSFFAEIDKLQAQGIDVSERMRVSDRAHLVFDFHQTVDGLKEAELGNAQVGTTRKGIGPAYANKASRSGLRVHHLFQRNDFRQRLVRAVASRQKRYGPFEYDVEAEIARYEAYAERLRPMVTDVVPLISDAVRDPAQQILVEGANALLLDIDYGTYPFVTSSNTTVGGVFTGLGVPPSALKRSIGVVKAYTTRVGSGPFPTELVDAVGEHLTDVGHEYGTTTGRKRRCGWLDGVALRFSHRINDYTSINLTKLDVLSGLPTLQIAVGYCVDGQYLTSFPADLSVLARVEVEYKRMPGWTEDLSQCTTYDALPQAAKDYVQFIQTWIGVPIEWIGVGAGSDAMIHLPLTVETPTEHA